MRLEDLDARAIKRVAINEHVNGHGRRLAVYAYSLSLDAGHRKTMQTPPDDTALVGGKLSLQPVVTARSADTQQRDHDDKARAKQNRKPLPGR